jgi:hypothetical protein
MTHEVITGISLTQIVSLPHGLPLLTALQFWLVEQLVGFMLSRCPHNGRVVVR